MQRSARARVEVRAFGVGSDFKMTLSPTDRYDSITESSQMKTMLSLAMHSKGKGKTTPITVPARRHATNHHVTYDVIGSELGTRASVMRYAPSLGTSARRRRARAGGPSSSRPPSEAPEGALRVTEAPHQALRYALRCMSTRWYSV